MRLLADGLERLVDERMRAYPGAGGYQWVEQLPIRYPDRGWRGSADSTQDPRFLLRVLTDEWRAFLPELTRVHTGYASELRQFGNLWAHNGVLPDEDVDRMFGTIVRLLRVSDAAPQIAAVRSLRDEFRALDEQGSGATSTAKPPVPESVISEPVDRATEPRVVASSPPMPDDDTPDIPAPELDTNGEHDGAVVDIRDHGPGQREMILTTRGVRVAVTYREAVNYALVHNQVSPLVEIVLTSESPEPVEVRALSVRLEGISDWRTFPAVILQPEETVTLDSSRVEWPLDHTFFAGLEEATASRMSVQVDIGGTPVTAYAPIRNLARNEWNGLMVPELLAAFVTPNSPVILDLLSRAADLLSERTGDPSLQGYQEGRERALQIGAAIYDAMAGTAIRYLSPPASFETDGQKIRSAETVLTDRWATCLDLAVTFAAAIEQAGLNPVIVMKRGHAFAGFLVTDSKLSDVVLTDSTMMSNLVRSNLLVTVELSAAVEGRALPFEAARTATEEHWDPSRIGEVSFVLDVASARRRIRPLPKVVRTGDHVLIEVERSEYAPLPNLTLPTRVTPSSRTDAAFPLRVERWRTSLLDLSLRNPLLKLKKTSGIELHVPEQALAHFEDTLASERVLHIRSGEELPEIHVAQGMSDASEIPRHELARVLEHERIVYARTLEGRHSTQLDRLRRQAKSVIEETGANNLYITLGAIKWFDGRGGEALAPMFLLPVTLTGSLRSPFTVRIEDGAEALPNYCLIEKLRRDFQLTLTTLEKPPVDGFGLDITGILRETREQIVASGARLSVESHVRLAMLQFSTLEMWRDVSENWMGFTRNPLVNHLVNTPSDLFIDPIDAPALEATDEATHFLPVPVDGSQLKAISWATTGRTFVLEGPPGTGKSQTITNMIADALGHGKSVLFVAEKQAALDIVRARLNHAGLGALSLNLHGRNQTTKSVREQLSLALELKVGGGGEHLRTLREQHLSLIRKLEYYPHALHLAEGSLPSVWSAEQTVLSHEVHLPGELQSLADPDKVPGRLLSGQIDEPAAYEAARQLGEAVRLMADREANPAWRIATSPTARLDLTAVAGRIQDLERAHDALDVRVRRALETCSDASGWSTLVPWLRDGENGTAITPGDLEKINASKWEQRAAELLAHVDAFETRFGLLLNGIGANEPAVDTNGLRADLEAASHANFFARRKAVERAIAQVSMATATTLQDLDQASGLLDTIDIMRLAARDVADRARQALNMAIPNGTTDFSFVLTEVAGIRTRILNAREALRRVPGAAALFDHNGEISAGTAESLLDLQRTWQALVDAFLPRRTDATRWQGSDPLVTRISASLPTWSAEVNRGTFTPLKRQRTLQAATERMSDFGLQFFVDKAVAHEIPSDFVELVVRLAVARARLKERLEHTELDAFRPDVRDRAVSQYIATSAEVRTELTRRLPAKVIAHRSSNHREPRGRGTFLAEISRRRGGTIRELFERHGNQLLETTPCVLASPYSAAKFIPANSVEFDLVVFDEASQIRVADAIGAMGRGRAVVVVGDSHQMPPSSMFETSEGDLETDEDEVEAGLTPADQESILSEAVTANLEKLRLTWHYRSRDERLISFSNAAYYHGELSTFPTPPVQRAGFGIHLVHVDGHFDGGRGGTRTNRIEADRIVREIEGRLRSDSSASIGVVTFNSQQRDLLLDLLETSSDHRIGKALVREDNALFVKNLENVQGDERDTILFSLAFSPDPGTGRLRLNFGPLTAQGGERRLNVAITRSRQEVVLFSSFGPAAIDLSRTSSKGMHDLRAYLEYASRGTTSTMLGRRHDSNLYRDQLADSLRVAGLDVQSDLGMSSFRVDLAVRVPESDEWLAVLLDGKEWADRPLVSDREALPTTVLVGTMGWKEVHRVWLPMWLRDPRKVVEGVREGAQRIAASAPAVGRRDGFERVASAAPMLSVQELPNIPEPDSAVTETDVGEEVHGGQTHEAGLAQAPISPTDTDFRVPNVVQSEPLTQKRRYLLRPEMPTKSWFKPAKSNAVGDREIIEDLENRYNRSSIRSELLEVIEAEGPVEEQRLARIVGLRFGMARVHESRRTEMLKTLPRGHRARDLLGDVYFWPAGASPENYSVYRVGDPTTRRRITEIPGEEVANAAVVVIARQPGIDKVRLIEELKSIFGYTRLGSEISVKFSRVLEILQVDGTLVVSGNGFHLKSFGASPAGPSDSTSRAASAGTGQPPTTATGQPAPTEVIRSERDVVLAVSSDTWYDLGHWAAEAGVLEGWQRRIVLRLGDLAADDKEPSEWQIAHGIRILREATEWGFRARA